MHLRIPALPFVRRSVAGTEATVLTAATQSPCRAARGSQSLIVSDWGTELRLRYRLALSSSRKPQERAGRVLAPETSVRKAQASPENARGEPGYQVTDQPERLRRLPSPSSSSTTAPAIPRSGLPPTSWRVRGWTALPPRYALPPRDLGAQCGISRSPARSWITV